MPSPGGTGAIAIVFISQVTYLFAHPITFTEIFGIKKHGWYKEIGQSQK